MAQTRADTDGVAWGIYTVAIGQSPREAVMMRPDRLRAVAGSLSVVVLLLAGGMREVYADHPSDWGGGGQGYELSRDDTVQHRGKASGSVKSTGTEPKGFGTFTQAFRADRYRGKRLRMTGYVKSDGVEGWAGLWIRVDGKDKTGLAFDNMQARPIKGSTDWQKYEIVLDVPDESEEIYFGFLVAEKGRAWVDDIEFEAVGKDVASTGLEIQPMDRVGELVKDLRQEPRNLDFER
jgi:hypothetical protein